MSAPTLRRLRLRVPAAALLVTVAVIVVGARLVASQDSTSEGPGEEPSLAPIAVASVPGAGAMIESRVVSTEVGDRRQARAAWVREVAAGTDIPARAIASYADATLLLAAEAPACGLRWTTLAGIGAIESIHGTFSGRTLLPDGTTSEPIIGIALDGNGGVRAIPATEQGTAWHGDDTWEHAVGPMQFLPATWADQQAEGPTDGDGDGVSDPFDLDDAAAAAGTYLCSAGGDLTTVRGWNTAVFTYNNSSDYIREVAADATAAARGSRERG